MNIWRLSIPTAQRIREVTERIVKESGTTALTVTHDTAHGLKHADRLLMLHAGRIVMDLNKDEMQRQTVQRISAQFAAHAGESLPDETMLTAS